MSGKPKKIDKALLKWMAKRQATQVEMAEALGCSVATLSRHFAEDMARWRSVGKIRLRAWQWKRARKGSDSMLIHMGKQYLDQSDKYKVETSGEPFDPLAAYAADPELMERALRLERDTYAATTDQTMGTVDAGETGVPGVDVPAACPGDGSVHDEAVDGPDDEPGGSPTAG